MFKIARRTLKTQNRCYNYDKLKPKFGKSIAEYIWVDGTGLEMRSKARVLDKVPNSVEEIPIWNFDGSSCYMADVKNSEVLIKPVAMHPDPFRRGDNVLVLCDSYVWTDSKLTELKPANSNFRFFAKKIFD